MNAVSNATVNASSADLNTAQGVASVSVLKKALKAQATSAAQLIASLPPTALATSGTVGTQVNTFG